MQNAGARYSLPAGYPQGIQWYFDYSWNNFWGFHPTGWHIAPI